VSTFVLVHGSWHGAWCWRSIVPALEREGHRAVAFDLPGHGEDPTPVETITLQHYTEAIVRVEALCDGPVILVGHSAGGPITAAVECAPELVAARIYVAGLLPSNGSPMFDLVKDYDPAFLATFESNVDGTSVRISEKGAREFLYPCCPSSNVEAAISRLTAEPVAPFQAPISVTDERGARVPAYYIETRRDRAVPLTMQRNIQSQHPFRRVFSLDSDHSPFFSAPHDLVSLLVAIASEY
jgi:pimeloyl-ACP methyl ester carboxylesterase